MIVQKRILIIEDDIALNNGLVLSLKGDNYQMLQAFSMGEAINQLKNRNRVDLVVLDINLPDGNGLELCKEIRKTSQVPIIFLTANDMEVDVISGFEVGGNDYITKPFSLAIFRARVAALLRRDQPISKPDQIIIDNFNFDFKNMLFFNSDMELTLSKTEQKLLRLLVLNKGNVLSRDTLLEKVWGVGSNYVDENALSVTIRRLRSKIEDDPSAPRYIQTAYGIGYTWAVDPDE